ncbi:hypothetical protein LSUB1_G000581 [Lachnellula subtilissima]|uniref:MARVEL domain-containing protein n=1 Tax=Lachnellula subtilissima TaxID=602034 RepID=A0A8H8S1J4_9HELO|nr:hypothetical protein LSUB1_G000581 [Lachnellula subtilissima]
MPVPQYGALGHLFTAARAVQMVCLIAIIGMASNFIAEIVAVQQAPHSVLIGTLTVTCIAALYIIISYILYFDNQLSFLLSTGVDSLLMVALIVIAVKTGMPISYLHCNQLSSSGSTSDFVESVKDNMKATNYWVWIGASKATCYEMKSIWGLSIGLCILFFVTAVASVCMWRRQKTGGAPAAPYKDVEGSF